EDFLPVGDDRFASSDRDARVTFLEDGDGEVAGFLWEEGDKERRAPRIGPLFHTLRPRDDPDPAATEGIVATLSAPARGGGAGAGGASVGPGGRGDFGRGPARELAALRSVTFLAERDVSSRGIERHEGAVVRVLHYRLATDRADRGLLVYLTADGLVTDYDI